MVFKFLVWFIFSFFLICAALKVLIMWRNKENKNIHYIKIKTAISSFIIILATLCLAFPDTGKFIIHSFTYSSQEKVSDDFPYNENVMSIEICENQFRELFVGKRGFAICFTAIFLIFLTNMIEHFIHRDTKKLKGYLYLLIMFFSVAMAFALNYTAEKNIHCSSHIFGYEVFFIIFVTSLVWQQYILSLSNRDLYISLKEINTKN